jgi:hypothetical protein
MRLRNRICIAALGVLLGSRAAVAQDTNAWPDSFLGRLEVLAAIEHLNGDLLASRSATATLEAWCADHRMAAPARIAAMRDRELQKPLATPDRIALDVGPDEKLRYRHVRLACGTHTLSEADNWYVPSRLTADMNHDLDTTDTPFGRVVQDLHPMRQTLSVERMWSPLPANWDLLPDPVAASATHNTNLTIPATLFRHHSVVFDAQRRPIAVVVETYMGEVLNFSR